MADNRFKDYPIDARFPSAGVDVRFQNWPVDGRFFGGLDTRFEGSFYGGGDLSSLFASGEIGWVEPMIPGVTLFQDAAGTIPVTAAGQPVGLSTFTAGGQLGFVQATALNRPIYGIHPITGRRNLLTFTEQLDNAIWSKSQVNVTQNAATDPPGSLADKAIPTTASGSKSWTYNPGFTSSGAWTFSRVVKADGYGFYGIALANSAASAAWYNLSTGAISSVGANVTATSAVSLGEGWWRVSLTTTQAISFIQEYVGNAPNFNAFTGDGVSGILVGGSQWEAGSTATAYQKVVSQYEVTEAGVQSIGYLSHNGVNQWMRTAAFAWGSDKVTICAGVRKLSGVGYIPIVEMSASYDSNGGVFTIGHVTSTVVWGSKGTISNVVNFGAPAFTNNVLTGIGDISGDRATLRVNATQVAQSTADQGTGNFGAYPLYAGARGGAQLFFNGNRYPSMGINRLLTEAELAQVEAWVNQRTGAF